MNRVNRCEFWAKILLTSGLCAVMVLGVKCLEEGTRTPSALVSFYFCSVVVFLLVVVFGVEIPLTIKRLHDVGRSGWWLLGWIVLDNVARNIPLNIVHELKDWVGLLLFLLLGFWPGNRDANAYGPPSELPASGLGCCGLVVRSRFRFKVIAIFFALSVLFVGLMRTFGPWQ